MSWAPTTPANRSKNRQTPRNIAFPFEMHTPDPGVSRNPRETQGKEGRRHRHVLYAASQQTTCPVVRRIVERKEHPILSHAGSLVEREGGRSRQRALPAALPVKAPAPARCKSGAIDVQFPLWPFWP